MGSELLRFGPFELDPVDEELRRAGLTVRIPRQPLRILLLLVRRAGEVVSREEIQAEIWGGETYVDFEHSINSAIRQIRFALGDHAETPRYVRTLPRRGYSFIAPVERIAKSGPIVVPPIVVAQATAAPAAAAASKRRVAPRMMAIAAAAILVIAAIATIVSYAQRHAGAGRAKTIAVQPFRLLGPPIAGVDPRSFTEELRATIGTLPRSRVAVVDARAALVVGGAIRQAEDGVRVIVSLTDTASRTQLWSETFHRPTPKRDGMAVEVAHGVMREIAGRFLPPPRREAQLRTGVSGEALSLYRRARLLHQRSQAYDWMRTRDLYAAAIEAEPRFAEAWSGLSDVWAGQALRGRSVAECDRAAAETRAAANRALALQPDNAEALSILAVLAAQRDYDLAGAEDLLRRAVAADPEYVDAHVNLAMVLIMRGQTDESLEEWQITHELDPVAKDLSPIEPHLYLHARRYEDARARYRDILAVSPESQPAIWGLMFTYIAQGNWREAITHAKAITNMPQQDVPPTREGFLRLYRSLEPFMATARPQGWLNHYFLALYYGQIGERDRAFALLDRAIDEHVPVVSYIMVDPRIDPLRTDPRFNVRLARLNLARPPERALIARSARRLH